MVDQDKVALDESHRIQKHEEVKDRVREDIHQGVKEAADHVGAADKSRLEGVASQLKEKAIREIGETEAELERSKAIARIGQVIDYLFLLIYGLIGMEILLEILGARESSGFKQFIDALSGPVLAPFRGLLFDPGVGPFRLMLSYMFAFFFYFLLHLAIRRLLRLFTKTLTQP